MKKKGEEGEEEEEKKKMKMRKEKEKGKKKKRKKKRKKKKTKKKYLVSLARWHHCFYVDIIPTDQQLFFDIIKWLDQSML